MTTPPPIDTWIRPSPAEAALLPGLGNGLIAIRPYRREDVRAVVEAIEHSRAELARWMPWCHPGYRSKEIGEWLAQRETAWAALEEFSFAIVREDDGRLIGSCGLNQISRLNLTANLGYWVRTDATGAGVASSAARLLARFGFIHLGLRRIEIVAAVDNVRSVRAAEKSRAAREGVLRNKLRLNDISHDAVAFSFVPDDFGVAAKPPVI